MLLSPMDQQDQIGQRLDLQQQEGGNFDRQVTCGCNAANNFHGFSVHGGHQGSLQGHHVGGLHHRCGTALHVANSGWKCSMSGLGVRAAVHISVAILPVVTLRHAALRASKVFCSTGDCWLCGRPSQSACGSGHAEHRHAWCSHRDKVLARAPNAEVSLLALLAIVSFRSRLRHSCGREVCQQGRVRASSDFACRLLSSLQRARKVPWAAVPGCPPQGRCCRTATPCLMGPSRRTARGRAMWAP